MRALLDTNIFLEVLLSQENAPNAKALLNQASRNEFFISDYSLHSIGLLLFRMKKPEMLAVFVEDALVNGGIRLLVLHPEDMRKIAGVAGEFGLDFDDAYQYTAAEQYGLTLVSFDSDFQRTDKGCKTPMKALQELL
jgi:predicted nucleic acid-binding protein